MLQSPYPFDKARLVTQEMTDLLVLDLVDKGVKTNQLTLTVGYDIENLSDPQRRAQYHGPVTTDRYGRKIPKHAHGTANLPGYSSSTHEIMEAVTALFDRIVSRELLVRRIYVTACRLKDAKTAGQDELQQLSLFADPADEAAQQEALVREEKMQEAMLTIRKKFGKNAILKGMNLKEGATARQRNGQIGGHKA